MPPKAKTKAQVPPPKPDPEAHLPDDVRALEAPPFEVRWDPLGFVVFVDEGLDRTAILEHITKQASIASLLDIDVEAGAVGKESEIEKEIEQAEQEHAASGVKTEFCLSAQLRAKIAQSVFHKQERLTWMEEVHRRRLEIEKAHAVVEDLEKVIADLQAAGACFTGEKASEKSGTNTEVAKDDKDCKQTVSKDEIEAQEKLEKARVEIEAAKLLLESAQAAQNDVFTATKLFWVEGCVRSTSMLTEMADAGFPLRGVIYLHTKQDVADVQEGGHMKIFKHIQKATQLASWDSVLGRTVCLELTVGEPPPVINLLSAVKKTTEESHGESPSGATDIALAFAAVTELNLQYNAWLQNANIYALDMVKQNNSHYELLLRSTNEEQASVPVLLFAMIEQVHRDACRANMMSELPQEQPLDEIVHAQTKIESILREWQDISMGVLVPEFKEPDQTYTLVVHGDDALAASCGLMTGYVRQKSHRSKPEPDAPFSQDEHGLLINGDSTLNIDNVEEYMRKLYQLPGLSKCKLQLQKETKVPMALGRLHARLMALAEYNSVCDIERFNLMTSIVALLPPCVQQEHGQSILSRQHFEQMQNPVLVQAMVKALCRFSSVAAEYCPWTQSVLVAFFDECVNSKPTCGIDCTISLSNYLADVTANGSVLSKPQHLYSLDQALVPPPCESKYFDSPDEGFGYIKREDQLLASKGMIQFSFGAEDQPCVIATLHGHTVFLAREVFTNKSGSHEPHEQIIEFVVTTAGGVSISLDTKGTVQMYKSKVCAKLPDESRIPLSQAACKELPESYQKETRRQILADGTVTKEFEDKFSVFLPSGDVSECPLVDGKITAWINTNTTGERWMDPPPTLAKAGNIEVQRKISGDANDDQIEEDATSNEDADGLLAGPTRLQNLEIAELIDPATQAVIKTREDLLLSVMYPSGERILEHPDGTRVTLTQKNWKVESFGLPAINGNPSGVTVSPSPGCTLAWNAASGALCLNWVEDVCVIGYGSVIVAPTKEARKSDQFIESIAHAVDNVHAAIQAKKKTAEARLSEARESVAHVKVTQAQNCNELSSAANVTTEDQQASPHLSYTDETEEASKALVGAQQERDTVFNLCLCEELACCSLISGLVYELHSGKTAIHDSVKVSCCPIEQNGDINGMLAHDSPRGSQELSSPLESEPNHNSTTDQEPNIPQTSTCQKAISSKPPMLFVVHPSGDGFEIHDSSAIDRDLAALAQTNTSKDIYKMPPNQTALPFPVPLGSHAITLVSELKEVDAQIPPLPLADDNQPYHIPHTQMHALSCLERPSTIQPHIWDSSSKTCTLTMPRATGQRVPIEKRPQNCVLVFREIVRIPPWEETAMSRLKDQMSKLELQLTQNDDSGQLNDGRTEQEQIHAARLAERLQELRKHRHNQIETVLDNAAKKQDQLTEDKQTREPENAPIISATKQKTPWPERMPPFHGTEKEPVAGKIMQYAKTEEGITAYSTDPMLSAPQTFSRQLLKKHEVQPCSAGASGNPGVYVTNKIVEEYNSLQPDEHQSKPMPSTQRTKNQKVNQVETLRSPYQNVNFDHPDLGYSLMNLNRPFLMNPKSVSYAVDGGLRNILPPLPLVYTREEARSVQNVRHIEMEDEALRLSRTACANLVHARGKSIRQFQLSPAHIHFGVVTLGSVIRRKATLMNVSLEKARFHVVRPPPPLRVVYKPRPLAAGMTAILEIELTGTHKGDFVGEIEVKSELNILHLTCSAKLVDEQDPAKEEETQIVEPGENLEMPRL